MTVENPNTIDAAGISKANGRLHLSILDHLDWDNIESHNAILEEKINRYIEFITNGQCWEVKESKKEFGVQVDIYFRHEVPMMVLNSLNIIRQQMNNLMQ